MPNIATPNHPQGELFPDPRAPLPASGWADTSRRAADAVRESAPAQRARVLAFIADRGDRGATIEEIATGLALRQASVCGRIAELARPQAGPALIRDSGRRRLTTAACAAKVWEACP